MAGHLVRLRSIPRTSLPTPLKEGREWEHKGGRGGREEQARGKNLVNPCLEPGTFFGKAACI